MAVRVTSAVVGALMFIAVYAMGLVPLKIGAVIISIIGMYELYTAVSGKLKPVHFVGFAAEIWYVFMYGDIEYYDPVNAVSSVKYIFGLDHDMILIAVIVLMVLMVAMHEKTSIHDVAITVFGFLYVGMLMYCLVILYQMNKLFIWIPLISAWGSDTCAYFVGVKFGKHKLAPVLSPKKSVEGAIGGVIGAAVLMTLFIFIAVKAGFIGYTYDLKNIWQFALVGAGAAAFSQVGDIAASKIKREMGVKDYGKIMPGHGGILDRFDSVLFTAPTVYILINWFVSGWVEM
ncbi:MAG: phosphatidate cytidylyltransferase [Firmicutes bacterium]|nr:phosphatidate cytidylyltransferase [Bacillota bacterium]